MENQKTTIIREFKLTSLAIDNKTSILLLTVMLFIIGTMAYNSMPRESYPEITQPEIYIGTIYPGNSPSDIENLITRPLEKEINAISGVKELKSTSIQDYSTIIASFDYDVPVKEALQEVKDAVDRAKQDLPSDLDNDPNVFELDFSEFPIMNINLYGNFTQEELREYAEYLQDEIENLSEISEVVIRGLLEKEVNIEVDILKMESMLISFRDIEDAFFQENVSMSGGDILTDGYRRNIRILGEFTTVEEMGEIIVKREDGDIVYLKDIANVYFGYEDRESFARLDGSPVVTLDVKKRGGENIIRASEKINDIIQHAKQSKFPKSLNIIITGDQSKQTIQMVSDLENNIISGVILVVVVLLFFLGLRNAMFVGIAIPLSMLIGILVLSITGTTLNMMVLFSLILALGMLVDNGIVVVENIYRLHSEGKPLKRAAKEGAGEVAWPIISSTATTLGAFLPLLFWKDTMGEFMKYLPLTLIITLTSSLFVGLVINPVLTAQFMKVETEKKQYKNKRFWPIMATFFVLAATFYLLSFNEVGSKPMVNAMANIFAFLLILSLLTRFVLDPASRWFRNRFLVVIENIYDRFIRFALRGYNPIYFFLGTIVLMIISVTLYFNSDPKVLFFPEQEPQYINVFIEAPLGTDIDETNRYCMQIEDSVNKVLEPYGKIIEATLALVGEGTSDPSAGPAIGKSPHKARINVNFLEFNKRGGVLTSKIMEEIRTNVKKIPGVQIYVDQNPVGPPTGKPISIEISGEDFEKLVMLSEDVRKSLVDLNVPGVEGLKSDLEVGKPELIINIDRDAARRFGISTIQIAAEIRTSLFGKEISKFKEGEDDYPIILRSDEKSRYNLQALLNKKITFQHMSTGRWMQVPISSVASVEYSSSFGSIKRRNMNRVIALNSNVNEGYNANEIISVYKDFLSNYTIPQGFTLEFAGEQEEQAETAEFLTFALMIALFLVFLIIVTQFNSIIKPLIIMTTVLFSTIGVFIGLNITSMPFVVLMTGIGIISLAGIVVNNAIVLIDYTNLIRERRRNELQLFDENQHLPLEDVYLSIINGGKTRLKPVLLTAITTILGLIPLAVGININFFTLFTDFNANFSIGGDSVAFWGPMSWTVIFGLAFATFLTLVIVPVMYLLADKVQDMYSGIERIRKSPKQ